MNHAERAYQVLRDKAIRFQLKPGERLLEVELARSLQMSRAPVREAMNRLVTEGLLTVVPNHGFSCRKLSVSEITALYRVRTDLEIGGFYEAAEQPDPLGLDKLAEFWRETTELTDTLSIEALVARDEKYHLQLAALARNEERLAMLQHINARIHFVRQINIENDARRKSTFAEHFEIITRLQEGDTAGAGAILRRHLMLSADEAKDMIRRGLERIYADSVA